MTHLIQVDIRGIPYWLKVTGPGYLYTWVWLKDNATKLTHAECQNWKYNLARNHCGWPLEIINT